MEIIQERLEREFNIDIVQTAPTVTYEILMTDGTIMRIDAPSRASQSHAGVQEIREPFILCNIIVPADGIGALMQLCEDRRGDLQEDRIHRRHRGDPDLRDAAGRGDLRFLRPPKSTTSGYGTMDYDLIGFRAGDLVKMDILVNGDRVDALSVIVHRDHAEARGRRLLVRLKEEIDRHLFEIPLQAAIGGKIIARETIKSVGKNVTAKCYGGDVSRNASCWKSKRKARSA